MRLLYAPLVSDRELRIEAGRLCWCRKGRRKEGKDAGEGDSTGLKGSSDNRGRMLAYSNSDALTLMT